jgi:hypothetical protein
VAVELEVGGRRGGDGNEGAELDMASLVDLHRMTIIAAADYSVTP